MLRRAGGRGKTPLADIRRRILPSVPLIAALGLLASLLEGAGIGLFVGVTCPRHTARIPALALARPKRPRLFVPEGRRPSALGGVQGKHGGIIRTVTQRSTTGAGFDFQSDGRTGRATGTRNEKARVSVTQLGQPSASQFPLAVQPAASANRRRRSCTNLSRATEPPRRRPPQPCGRRSSRHARPQGHKSCRRGSCRQRLPRCSLRPGRPAGNAHLTG